MLDADGKLYDAYVAYPRLFGDRANKELEGFALHTMPQVLEGKCGYKLFIPGRDNLPGEGKSCGIEQGPIRSLITKYTTTVHQFCHIMFLLLFFRYSTT